MQVLLVAGGDPNHWPAFSTKFEKIIGIDRGNLFLLRRGIVPDLAIGDFDSLNEKEKEEVFGQVGEVLTAPAEKDDTDTQLALVKAFERFPQAEVTLIGATGGRLDHLLANLWLGLEPRFQPFLSQITISDRGNTIKYLAPGSYRLEQEVEMKYVAFCCLTSVKELSLTNFKYELKKADFPQPTSLASNEFLIGQAEVSFSKGMIAVIQSRDV
ncbi:thiamine diphosphokinase [Enterococcus devriesei]|uniref:thiamine diphosphokinase n=1 Tax=Enterococcus TaxID=1350 RepID=UPI001C11A7BD|nr:thiamine diphosphokinase [Enterococcus devriesei]MBU5366276.1 thiamine diphosphokinase [Enterococcus devriesei]MDT2821608.1 thiamine diphosphokinase [Enterococcus devriesei]